MLTYRVSKKMLAPKSTWTMKRLKTNSEGNQLTKSPYSKRLFNTSLLNKKRAEGHQTFDESSSGKDSK